MSGVHCGTVERVGTDRAEDGAPVAIIETGQEAFAFRVDGPESAEALASAADFAFEATRDD